MNIERFCLILWAIVFLFLGKEVQPVSELAAFAAVATAIIAVVIAFRGDPEEPLADLEDEIVIGSSVRCKGRWQPSSAYNGCANCGRAFGEHYTVVNQQYCNIDRG